MSSFKLTVDGQSMPLQSTFKAPEGVYTVKTEESSEPILFRLPDVATE